MTHPSFESQRFFNPTQARWLLGVLAMLTKVVGPRTCLGVILAQARGEVASLLADTASLEAAEEHHSAAA